MRKCSSDVLWCSRATGVGKDAIFHVLQIYNTQDIDYVPVVYIVVYLDLKCT